MKTIKNKFFLICCLIIALFSASFVYINFESITKVQASSTTNVYNNAIFVTFEDGNTNWINETLSSYGDTFLNLYKNALNLSPNSVTDYYKTMSYGSINLQTNFYTNGNSAVVVPFTLNELLPYSPTNPDGYFEYEAAVYFGAGTPSMLSSGYLFSTHKYNIYTCAKNNSYHSDAPCDLDLSDGIGCMCAYNTAKANSSQNLVLYDHIEHYVRLIIALKSALSQVYTNITGDIDYNNDNYVDMLSFIFPEIESGKVNWSDLLWAHQGELNIADHISSFSIDTSELLETLQTRGLRNASEDELNLIFTDYKIENKTPKSYICLTTEHLTSSSPLIDKNGTKTLTNFVFAHELGHALGLADYYVYNDDTDTAPVNYWDLMGYNYNGFPIYMTTYSRELLGFTNSNNVVKIENNGTYTLKPTSYDEVSNNSINSNNVLAYYIEDENYPDQKIYIEYRYKQGKYDSGPSYKSNGIIIYRVDEGVVQQSGLDGLKSSGNFGGYPYNIEILATRSSGEFGNSNTNNLTNAITFQTYDNTKDQYDLSKSDVTFVNTGLVISNISINTTINEISFTIQFNNTPEMVDLSSVTLNGTSLIDHEVKTSYSDLGINFGEFSETDFDININNLVDINTLGTYTYSYTLTYKATNQILTLTRTIVVKDTTAPTITLIGNSIEYVDSFSNYVEAGYTISDNYNSNSEMNINIQNEFNAETNTYIITYTVTDTSGNETRVTRTVKITGNIYLNGESTVILEVKTQYSDLGLTFNNCSESDFQITPSSNLNVNVIGEYTYTYTIIEKLTDKQTILTRTIIVKDTTAPTLIVLDDVEIYKDELQNYLSENVVEYYDNYYDKSSLTFIENINDQDSNKYVITYTVIDPSGNKTEKSRTFKYKYIPIKQENIVFKINPTSINKKLYTNSVIKFTFSTKASASELSRLEKINTVVWTIDGEVKTELNDKQEINLQFTNAGKHTIEISVNGNKVYSETITIIETTDNSQSEIDANDVSFLIILAVIFVIGGTAIPVTLKIKQKREGLDKY